MTVLMFVMVVLGSVMWLMDVFGPLGCLPAGGKTRSSKRNDSVVGWGPLSLWVGSLFAGFDGGCLMKGLLIPKYWLLGEKTV